MVKDASKAVEITYNALIERTLVAQQSRNEKTLNKGANNDNINH